MAFICEFCFKELLTTQSKNAHQVFCKNNPNRKYTYSENWNEDKRIKHSNIMKIKNTNSERILTDEQRAVLSKKKQGKQRKILDT